MTRRIHIDDPIPYRVHSSAWPIRRVPSDVVQIDGVRYRGISTTATIYVFDGNRVLEWAAEPPPASSTREPGDLPAVLQEVDRAR